MVVISSSLLKDVEGSVKKRSGNGELVNANKSIEICL